MAWTLTALGTLAGVTTAINALTGVTADLTQIAAVKTLLLSEVGGICTVTFNGARLTASGDPTVRTVQISLIPVVLNL